MPAMLTARTLGFAPLSGALFLCWLWPAGAAAGDKHLGVASCAGSACHGAARMLGAAVRQDEYLLWQRRDRHARAYATLRSERSRRIAANLGLKEATEARECLGCHADFVPVADRGERYQLSDGVGCETCHGAAERWLSQHVRGYASHRDRVSSGLFPTWEPQARAELCLSCHQGDARRPMSHAIMGAGHPPLLFELDTFGALQPAHYEADADYIARKGQPDGARQWAVGQAVAARELLEGVSKLDGGLFPEWVWFDCNACHHPMQPPRWQPELAPGVPPGQPRLADSSVYLTALWLETVKPELGARVREDLAGLHRSSARSREDLRDRAQALATLFKDEVLPLAVKHEHSAAQLRQLTLRILDSAAGPRAGDFSTAEQVSMAAAVLVTALAGDKGPAPKRLHEAVNAVYAAVDSRERYDAEKMRRALRDLHAQIGKAFPLKR